MSLLKDEETYRLDELQRVGGETLDLFALLAGRVADPALRSRIEAHGRALAQVLEQTAERRRARGEQPQTSDPERSHLEAMGARLRALVLPGDVDAHHVESLLEASEAVERQLDLVLELDPEPQIHRPLAAFRERNREFEAALRARDDEQGS